MVPIESQLRRRTALNNGNSCWNVRYIVKLGPQLFKLKLKLLLYQVLFFLRIPVLLCLSVSLCVSHFN